MAERILVSLLVLIVLATVGIAVWLAVRPRSLVVAGAAQPGQMQHAQFQPLSITGQSISIDAPTLHGVLAPGAGLPSGLDLMP